MSHRHDRGAIGTFARYVVSVLALPISRDLPWGTIIISVTGSFIIGLFGTLTLAHGRYPVSDNMRLFVMVGLCGGYTTFWSFSLQTFRPFAQWRFRARALNIAAPVTHCIIAVAAGHLVAAHMNGRATQIVQLSIEEEG